MFLSWKDCWDCTFHLISNSGCFLRKPSFSICKLNCVLQHFLHIITSVVRQMNLDQGIFFFKKNFFNEAIQLIFLSYFLRNRKFCLVEKTDSIRKKHHLSTITLRGGIIDSRLNWQIIQNNMHKSGFEC